MSDIKAKMHKIRFPTGGDYSAPPDLLAVFKGPTSNGREGKTGRGRERAGKGRERDKEGKRRGKVSEGEGPGPQIFWPRTSPRYCRRW